MSKRLRTYSVSQHYLLLATEESRSFGHDFWFEAPNEARPNTEDPAVTLWWCTVLTAALWLICDMIPASGAQRGSLSAFERPAMCSSGGELKCSCNSPRPFTAAGPE